MIEAVGIFPNVSNCMQISMKHLYITLIGMNLFELARVDLFYWNLANIFPIYGNISNFNQI